MEPHISLYELIVKDDAPFAIRLSFVFSISPQKDIVKFRGSKKLQSNPFNDVNLTVLVIS